MERNGDVTVYPSVQQAECAVESVDAEDGEYGAVYDADGRLLELHVETPTKRRRSWLFPWFETLELTPVRLRPKEGLPSHRAKLRAAPGIDQAGPNPPTTCMLA